MCCPVSRAERAEAKQSLTLFYRFGLLPLLFQPDFPVSYIPSQLGINLVATCKFQPGVVRAGNSECSRVAGVRVPLVTQFTRAQPVWSLFVRCFLLSLLHYQLIKLSRHNMSSKCNSLLESSFYMMPKCILETRN